MEDFSTVFIEKSSKQQTISILHEEITRPDISRLKYNFDGNNIENIKESVENNFLINRSIRTKNLSLVF